MTVSFHFVMDDSAIENKGTFCEAFQHVVNEMLSDEDKNAISVDIESPENNADSEDEADCNMINLTLDDTNSNQRIDRYHDIFKMFISIIRRPDGSFPYIP